MRKGLLMNTYIALFRGINVGGKNILPMNELVKILESIGCKKVQSYIQSGNVIFQIKPGKQTKIAEEISLKIFENFGFEPKVLIIELADLYEAVDNNPFNTQDGKSLHFSFLDKVPESPDLDSLNSIKTDSEEFKLIQKIFYLYAPDGVGRSKLAAKVEQKLGVSATARNWNTIKKLISMAENISTGN